MKPLVDLHCHYVSQDPNALDNFRRLVESPDVCRVAVCALDLKLPRDGRFPFMSDFATTNEQLAEFVALLASPKVVPWVTSTRWPKMRPARPNDG